MDAASLPASRRGRRNVAKADDNSSAGSTPFVSAPSSPRNSISASQGSPSSLSNTPRNPSRPKFEVRKSETSGTAVVILSSWNDNTEISKQDEQARRSSAGLTSDSEDFPSYCPGGGSDFDFSATFSEADGTPVPMSSADELFYNGQIRPLEQLQFEQSSVPRPPGPPGPRLSNDGYFDFRKSANYTLSAPQSPKQEQSKKERSSPTRGSSNPTSTPALEQWKKMSKEARRRMSAGDLPRRHVQTTDERARTADIDEVPRRKEERSTEPRRNAQVERQRRPRAREATPGGSHRRARSLSPLRVFHMDDEPRQSFESKSMSSSTSTGAGGDESQEAGKGKRSKGRRTLKELLLLHMGKAKEPSAWRRRDDEKKPIKGGGGAGAGMATTRRMKLRAYEGAAATCKNRWTGPMQQPLTSRGRSRSGPIELPSRATSKNMSEVSKMKQQQHVAAHVSPHELHYTSQRAQAEQMRKRTFLPYRNGLLGCLGFTSKFGSLAGFNTKP